MLTLKITPIELRVMIGYLRFNTEGQEQMPLLHQPLDSLIMMDYLTTWKAKRLLAWQMRRVDKEYKLSLPLPLAKALHQHMQSVMLTVHQQLFLNRLDEAIVSYRNPYSDPHLIGDLLGHL